MTNTPESLRPTGKCWCGCGKDASPGSFWSQGHDKIAESALVAAEYGGTVPQLLAAHGYGPDKSVTAAAVDKGGWVRCIDGCWYAGRPAAVDKHRRIAGH